MSSSSPEADAALLPLQGGSLGSLTIYIIPEASSLLPQVQPLLLLGVPSSCPSCSGPTLCAWRPITGCPPRSSSWVPLA